MNKIMDEPQKLFSLPGTIEEEDEQRKFEDHRQLSENLLQNESPYLTQKISGNTSNIPRNITLVRVSTQSSSIGGVGRQDSYRSRYRTGPVRKIRRRAVLKNGECNVLQSKISRRSLRFLQDIFTTLVDTQWRWTLLCFSLSFVLSWLGFAVIWWLIAFTHGDFDSKHLPPYQIENNWTPCVYNIFSFTSCFLFSIETQHTIGYGSRSTSEECPEAIFVMCIQSISGVMIQAFMVGIVFAKMSRPKQRTQTLLFSKNAVVCQRDGELCFMFRVADMRKSHIIGANVRAQIIRNRSTKEGEILSQYQEELNVGTDGDNGNIFFIWPMTIIHKINSNSPFYNMSAEDMLTERFEVVVILEGTIESTGQTTQARSSYLPQEILWGHRFEPMVSYSKDRQGYEVDHSLFNSTTQVDTPLCSGRELTEFYRAQDHTTGFMTDDDEISEDLYHDINQQYLNTNYQRSTMGLIDPVMITESLKSDTSFNENCNNVSKNCCCINKDNDCKIIPSSIQHQQHNINNNNNNSNKNMNNNNNHCKLNELNSDTIQVVGEIELKNLSEAVNSEIIKNCKDIVFNDDNNSEVLWKNSSRNSLLPTNNKLTELKYHHFDEEKQSLIGSRKNLSNRSVSNSLDADEKRLINSSKRHFSNNSNYRKLNGSKEGFNKHQQKQQQNLNNEKDNKKHLEVNKKKKLVESICDEECENLISNQIESEDKKLPKLLATSTQNYSNNNTCVYNKSVTPTSELNSTSDSNNTTPHLHLTEPNNLLILRNRKSYENALLQDVNNQNPSINVNNGNNNLQINNHNNSNNNSSIIHTISYTTV